MGAGKVAGLPRQGTWRPATIRPVSAGIALAETTGMPSSARCVAGVIALTSAAACLDPGNDDTTSPTVSSTEQSLASPTLGPGDKREWTFSGTQKPGIDPRLQKLKVKAAKNISFKYGPAQRITMTATNENDGGQPAQADIALAIADIPVTGNGNHYYKAWLEGTVEDSDNKALGFCGSGGFPKGEFHTQLQMAFLDGNRGLGLCYCNICPATDGHGVWCATDQWQTPVDDPPKVSGDGACKAPAQTTHVLVTLEAIAKGDKTVHHHGTAVFRRVVVGRCHDDGSCSDLTPSDYGK
jgi:hypothetical protein